VDRLSSLGHQERARALLEDGRLREALAAAQEAAALAPENPFARRTLARVLAKSGRGEEARGEYAAALALAREKSPAFHPRLVLSLEEESSDPPRGREDQSTRGAGPS
jgi:tetratricopeptide (TPR) repeat protein